MPTLRDQRRVHEAHARKRRKDMLEEASWIATIIGTALALIWAGKTTLNRIETRQNARVSGRNNTVNQSSKVGKDK